jgi:ATP-binding cassette subfamily B protein
VTEESAQIRTSDLELLGRYADQPCQLPTDVRGRIEASWGDQPVQLYALADLDATLRFGETWVALGPEHLAEVRRDPTCESGWQIQSFERKQIQEVREAPGLSCTVFTILAEPGRPALAILRFTHRQRRAMENIRFVLDEALSGRSIATGDADARYIDSLARPVRDAQALVANRKTAVLWRLLAYLLPYRRQLFMGMSAALLITGFALVPPYLAGHLLDEIGVWNADRSAYPDFARHAWLAIGVIAISYLLRQACAWVRLRHMSILGEWVARDLRTELYEHLQHLSLSFFSRKKTGSLITRVSADTDRLWEFLALGVVDVSLSLVMLLGLSAVLLSLDWRLGLVMTLPVPLLCIAIFLYGERLNRLFLRAWRKWSNVTDVLSDTIPGMKVVKAFNQEDREIDRFDRRNHAVTDEFNGIHRLWTAFWPTLMLAIHAMTVGVWFFALPRLLAAEAGSVPLSHGTFVSFLLYTTMFVAPIEIIGQMARVMNRATSSAHRVFEVLDTEPEVVDRSEPMRLEPVMGSVSFENVSFGYDGVRQVIRGMSLEVAPGEMIGLVGPSGGGKTTFANLIARFYDVTGGELRIDGCDIRDLDAGHYRRQLGMVLQDPYLFHGTVLENIRYGMPEAGLEKVIEAARAANAHDFICDLEHGYDTVVGERGHTLSGGERQRVSIARAVLSNPRILILDEATSSVDTETERKIQEALDRLTAGRTVFAIAHRLSTLRKADRLIVIEDGKIVEEGSHSELLERPDGRYARLSRMQQELAVGA